jgi:putative membrane protein
MLYLIATFAIAVLLIFIENKCNINFLSIENSNFFYLVLCGFFMSIGIVVPGVSSSVILILLGIYNIYLDSISTLYLPVLFPLGIGVIIGGLVFLNLIKYLLLLHQNFLLHYWFYNWFCFSVNSFFQFEF